LILQCDIKPNNILLDDGMVADLSNFSIAKLVTTICKPFTRKLVQLELKGTVGYDCFRYDPKS